VGGVPLPLHVPGRSTAVQASPWSTDRYTKARLDLNCAVALTMAAKIEDPAALIASFMLTVSPLAHVLDFPTAVVAPTLASTIATPTRDQLAPESRLRRTPLPATLRT